MGGILAPGADMTGGQAAAGNAIPILAGQLRRMQRQVPALVVALAVLLVAAGSYAASQVLRHAHALAVETAEARAGSLARAYGEHVGQLVRRLDHALLHLRDEYEHDRSSFPARAPLHARLHGDLAFQAVAADAAGRLVFSYPVHLTGPVLVADRAYFHAHRDDPEDRLRISEPLTGRVSGQWTLQFSRPLRAPGGAFDGVMLLSVDPGTLARFHDASELGPAGFEALLGPEGMVRGGSRPDVADLLPLAVLRDPGQPAHGVLRHRGGDGSERLVAYRRLPQDGLVAVAALDGAVAMAGFQSHRRSVMQTALVVTPTVVVALLLVAWLAQRQARQQARLAAAQRELARTEERWRLALDAVGDGVWDWDATTGAVFYSARWKAMLGHGEDEVSPRLEEWETRIHPDDRARTREDVARHLSGETPVYANEHRVRCKDGRYKWILDRGVVVSRAADGTPLRVVGTHTDITGPHESAAALERQRAELQRSNEELEAFAYVASHDLRQPLRTIGAYLTLLEKDLGDRLDDDARECIVFARDGARRMDRLVVDLLEYSRVGRKARPSAAEPAGPILEAALAGLEVAVAEAGATVTLPPDPPTLWGDGDELMRLFANLLGNAVKYRAPGRAPVIRVTWAAEGGMAHFRVADNGIGIPADGLERIFGIFQRLHARDAYEGTGIGLAICRKVAERHGGRIWAESVPGEGSTFHVLLPLAGKGQP